MKEESQPLTVEEVIELFEEALDSDSPLNREWAARGAVLIERLRELSQASSESGVLMP